MNKLLCLLLWSCQTKVLLAAKDITIYGFQSGGFKSSTNIQDTSNSYASSIHYDPVQKAAYIVGSTYWSYWSRAKHSESQIAELEELDEPDCFLAVLARPEQGQTMNLAYSRRFGKEDVEESCSALTFLPSKDGKTKIVAAGHTNAGGFLTSLRFLGTPLSTVYGFLLNLDLDISSNLFGINSVQGSLTGGALLNDHEVQYPIAIAANPAPLAGDEGSMYVVSLSSPFKDKNSLGANLDKRPDTAAAGGMDEPEYGNHYSVFLKKVITKSEAEMNFEQGEADLLGVENDEGGLKQTLRKEWTELLSPSITYDDIFTEHYLQISDLKYVSRKFNSARDDLLLLVGTTSGYGAAFGGENPDADYTEEAFNYKAGFITTFDTEGKMIKSTRIELEEEDVVFKGTCVDTSVDKPTSFYVVGETRGLVADDMEPHDLSKDPSGRHSRHGFIMKVNIDTLEREWTRQLGGTLGRDAISYGCAVSPGDDVVYMAGTIADGDKIKLKTEATSSAGGDDIFVANYDSSNGKALFVKQVGSSENDWLARGNGIVCDDDGNAILLGNTRGSMMRFRAKETLQASGSEASDIFVMSVEKGTGAMKTVSEITGKNDDPFINDNSDLGGMDITAISVGAFVAFLTTVYMGYRIYQSSTADQRANNKTLKYLDNFHDPDYELHIRNSATGGIHAVYGSKRSTPMTTSQSRAPQSRAPRNTVDSDIAEVMKETSYMSTPKKTPPKAAFASKRQPSIKEDDLSFAESSLAGDDDSAMSYDNQIV